MASSELLSVGILGFGWVGQALARNLSAKKNINVQATVTSEAKQKALAEQFSIAIHLLNLTTEEETLAHPIFEQEAVIICIPPRFKQGREDYPDLIAQVVKRANMGKTRKLILLSSTGIYAGLTGVVNEDSSLMLNDDKAKLLFNAEQQLQQFKGDWNVLRLAGLVGPERHPGRFFNATRPIQDAQLAVNLVHQQDVVQAISTLLASNCPSQVFNLCTPFHPSKKAFYQAACADLGKLGLSSQCSAQDNRIVNGDKIAQLLPFSYQHQQLDQWSIYRE